MAWEASKDKELGKWEIGGGNLVVTVNSYDGGDLKIGLVRTKMVEDEEGNEQVRYFKAGRLALPEFEDLCAIQEEIIAVTKKGGGGAKKSKKAKKKKAKD